MQIWCGFSRGNGVFSKVIQVGEARAYSHAYIRYECPISGVMMVFQASKGLVNCFNYDIFKQSNSIIKEHEIQCSSEQFKAFYKFKCESLGKKYSYKQILWFTLKKLFQVSSWSKDAYSFIKNGNKEYICSEIAAIVCTILGIHLDLTQIDQISPSDLDTILSNI